LAAKHRPWVYWHVKNLTWIGKQGCENLVKIAISVVFAPHWRQNTLIQTKLSL